MDLAGDIELAPPRPNEHAEERLVSWLLGGRYPPGSTLPAERLLATQLGVTRPTLREVLRRLERDGWLTIRQGKATVVRDFWVDGGLNVLGALTASPDHLAPGFVTQLLEVRLALVPPFTRLAVKRAPAEVVTFLGDAQALPDTPEAFATYDWELHRLLTRVCGNPVFGLILNGFAPVYENLAPLYFLSPEARTASRGFYLALQKRAAAADAHGAERLTRVVMRDSIRRWRRATRAGGAS